MFGLSQVFRPAGISKTGLIPAHVLRREDDAYAGVRRLDGDDANLRRSHLAKRHRVPISAQPLRQILGPGNALEFGLAPGSYGEGEAAALAPQQHPGLGPGAVPDEVTNPTAATAKATMTVL